MAKRPKTVSVRIYEETRDALLLVQSRMRADQVRLGLPRKKSRFALILPERTHTVAYLEGKLRAKASGGEA